MTGHHGGRVGARSPKSDESAREAFRPLVPDDPRVTVRPMFGSVAAFIEGQMFMGLFADELFVRLAEEDRMTLMAAGGAPLEPMPGKPMREYVAISDWQQKHDLVRAWAAKALDYALSLPPKKK
jgi:TfoX/Sxy family transcriptional regulator of competence genes